MLFKYFKNLSTKYLSTFVTSPKNSFCALSNLALILKLLGKADSQKLAKEPIFLLITKCPAGYPCQVKK